nr:unnamed protein product [Callosobruchus analis]
MRTFITYMDFLEVMLGG